jgi:hypothetical protein
MIDAVVDLPLNQIKDLDTVCPRFSLIAERIDDFADLYLADGPQALPAIEVVAVSDGTYLLDDGFHRLFATRQIGWESIPAKVVQVPAGQNPIAFAYLRALEASATAAKPLTSAEKRAAVDRLLLHIPSLSDRQVGRLCGLSHQTVGRRRAQLVAEEQDGDYEDPGAEIPTAQSAEKIARRLVSGVDRMWAARGIGDRFFGDSAMGKHLAGALRHKHAENALQWARRLQAWADHAVAELESE